MEGERLFHYVAVRCDGVGDFAPASPSGDASFRVAPTHWPTLARLLRDDPALAFDFLANLTAVDWLAQEVIELVYHLWSYRHRHGAVVKLRVPRRAPTVPSVASVWRAAEWNEREQFDLFGVAFAGHPDLRRLLMPDDWPGHPMRKDYVEAPAYGGMPTTRPDPLTLLPLWDAVDDPSKRR